MLEILKMFNLFKYRRVHIDNSIFRLHYSVTVVILLVFFAMIGTKQFVGQPMLCSRHDKSLSEEMLNTYCWTQATYTSITTAYKQIGVEIVYPRVNGGLRATSKDIKRLSYYQWVYFVLLFQAFCFHAPRWIWKGWEGGKIEALVEGISLVGFTAEQKKSVVDYFRRTRGQHDGYASKFFVCEIFHAINVFLQILVLDELLDGDFIRYGVNVVKYYHNKGHEADNPMVKVFPKMSMCSFYKYGPSGQVEADEAICLLSLNVINEKIFLFLWFWYFALFLLTIFCVLFHLIIFSCPLFRSHIVSITYRNHEFLSMPDFTKSLSIGDCLLLHLFRQNVDSVVYNDVVIELVSKGGTKVIPDKVPTTH